MDTCLGVPDRTELAPLNADGTSVFKRETWVPVSFRACDPAGQPITTAGFGTGGTLVGAFERALEDFRSSYLLRDRPAGVPPVGRHGRRMYSAGVADAAAGVVGGVGVQHFAPEPRLRHAEEIVLARHRREIAHDQGRWIVVVAETQEGDDTCLVVGCVDPFEAAALAVEHVKRRRLPVEPVEIAHERLHAAMVDRLVADHAPRETEPDPLRTLVAQAVATKIPV